MAIEFAAGESNGKQRMLDSWNHINGWVVGWLGGFNWVVQHWCYGAVFQWDGVAAAAKSTTAIWPVDVTQFTVLGTTGLRPVHHPLHCGCNPNADTRILFCLLCGCLM